ncbi:choice-of-anchor L domain-containing protein, partial [Flavobacterium sp. RHBU_24]|uniref:choice-of-anchor L domain-containing protein n=1 Tax=Flavobacterium sp. RHBU_24 TaxID=3391185 RepID=UPI003984B26D
MRKNLLINLLFILTAFGLYAQTSNIVVTSNNPDLEYQDGEVNTFVWSVTNNGPQALTNVYVTYPIPSGITIPTSPAPNGALTFWWTGSNGSSGTNVALSNTIASLAVNQTVTYTIKIYIPHEYVLPLPGFKLSAIEVVNTDNQLYYTPGTPSVYTVTVTNNGPDDQSNVTVLNTFPAAVVTAGITWSASNGASGTGNINNSIASLPAGATVTYTVTANVPSNFSASLSSNVSYRLSSGNVNTSGQCTQCNDTDTRIPLANVVVTNTDGQATYIPGTTNTYTLTVQNSGPAAAANVHVQNAIPAGITNFSWTGNGAYGVNTALDNTITSLPNGQSVVYTITLEVPEGFTGNLVSTASVATTGSLDTDVSCPACTDTDIPASGANIVVTNTNGQASYVAGGTSVYTVTVTNQGPDAATNVVVSNAIPQDITGFSWVGSNGSNGIDTPLSDTIAALAVGETVTYTITINVPATYNEDLLVSTVAVTSDTTDPAPGCDNCTDTDYNPANAADVVVVNTDNSPTYTNGNTSTYTVTVTNNGPGTATNILLTWPVPFGVSDFEWTGNGTSNSTATTTTIPSLEPGDSVVFSVSFTAPDDYYEPITFTVNVSSDNDPDTSCTACSDTNTNAFPIADLVVTNTDGQELYTPGSPNVYTITVVNNGPAAAPNVVVTAPLPAGTTVASWTGSNTTAGAGELNTTIPSLAVGETVTYTYTVDVPASASGPYTIEAAATSDATDIEPACTACTDTDYTLGTADLETVISLPASSYIAGADAIYTVTITNNGPDAAGDVAISNTVPTGFTAAQVTWSGSDGSSGTGALNNTIPVLLPGEIVTYTYTIAVPSNYPENDIVNSVAVTSSTTDPTPACTTCSILAVPTPKANLITVKTDGQSTYIIEDEEQDGELVYTITVTNAGPSDAYNVNIFDQRPTGIDNMTWSNADNTANGISTLNQTIPVLPAGESVVYTVTLYVPDDFTGTLTNTAVVTSDTPDPDPSCPNCSDSNTRAVNYVTVTKNQFTVPQLIEDVLIDTDCVTIQNITWSAGDVNSNFGIGYFEANNSNFPIQSGIVIRSGNALNTAGPYVNGANPVGTDGTGAGGTDTQLQDVSDASGQFDTVSDVSYIQFEFVPVSDHMSFDFLFASNEYGTFQCGYSDVFAFLLSDLTDSTLMTDNNIALVPGTDTPVSVTNIRNSQYNGQCGSANVAFFGQYNQSNQANAAINMIGQTVKMTAEHDVIPGHVYRIKLAIGDYIDQNYDSAVFLEAGSFDIGQPELPTDLTFANGGAICFGETYDIVATIENPNMLVKWQKDDQWIYNTDGSFYQDETYTVTQPGKYTILGYFAANPECFITDDVIVNYFDEIITGDPETLFTCGNGGNTAVFNLNDNIPNLEDGMVVEPGLLEFYFYTTLAAAQNNGVPIFPTNTFSGTDGQTIYVRINDYESSCYDIKTFTLDILDCDVPVTPVNPLAVCEVAPFDSEEVFNLTSQEALLMSQFDTPSNYTITYHNSQEDADTGENDITNPQAYTGTTETIYIRVEYNDYDFVFATETLQLIVNPQPQLEPFDDVSVCDSYTLPPLTQGQYRTQSGGGGNVLPAGASIVATQTIYVFASSGTAPYTCTDEQSFTVSVFPSPVVPQPDDEEVCDSYTLPVLTVGNYFTGPGGTGTALFAGNEITQTDDIYIYAESGDANVTCNDESMFTVTVNYAPVLTAITPLELCDDGSHDLVEIFDLSGTGPESVNNQSGYNYIYYTSEQAANTGGTAGQITNPFAYSSTTASVYVRVAATGVSTDCYSVGEISLIVHEKPIVPTLSDYLVCDDTAPAQDGVETFDLTSKNAEATADPTDTVTYYTDNGDAQLGQNAITNPSSFQNTLAGEQTIWVRVETVNGCADTGSFKLIVNPLPLADLGSPVFYACEETPGQGLFDLDEIDPVITGGQP